MFLGGKNLKYGIVTYADRPVSKGNKNRPNLGDPIQIYAMKYVYQQMGISENNLIEVSRYHSMEYDGEYVVLPFNCFNMVWNQFGLPYKTLPLSNKIIPVFLSFHLHSRVLSEEILCNLRTFQPIGCRDEETMNNMRLHGIRAYLSGCVTALLPKRIHIPTKEKVFFVDIPSKLKGYIPKNLLQNGEFISHQPPFMHIGNNSTMTKGEYQSFYQNGVKLLERYRDEATLIVTSRLHAATPCMAMGIPVILVSNRFDERFSFLDRYLPFYTPELFSKIEWSPSPVEYETQKKKILYMFIQQIQKTYLENIDMCSVSEFYEHRKKEIYNKSFFNDINKIKKIKGETINYAIWGITSQSLQLINLIKDICPKWNFVAAIDRKVTGLFEGKKVIKSEQISELGTDILFFVIPEAAHDFASNLLSQLGKSYVLAKEDGMVLSFT